MQGTSDSRKAVHADGGDDDDDNGDDDGGGDSDVEPIPRHTYERSRQAAAATCMAPQATALPSQPPSLARASQLARAGAGTAPARPLSPPRTGPSRRTGTIILSAIACTCSSAIRQTFNARAAPAISS